VAGGGGEEADEHRMGGSRPRIEALEVEVVLGFWRRGWERWGWGERAATEVVAMVGSRAPRRGVRVAVSVSRVCVIGGRWEARTALSGLICNGRSGTQKNPKNINF